MSYGRPSGSDGSYGAYRQVPRESGSAAEFGRLAHTVGTNIQKISQNTSQIQRMVAQLGTVEDTTEMLERLQNLQHYTNQLAKETNQQLKELGSLPPMSSQAEQRQRKMQRERLMNEFSAALNNFQATQRRAADKERENVARARAQSRVTENFFDEGPREGTLVNLDGEEDERQLQSEEPAITEEDLEDIKERETAIRQLEADIMDVNQIFKDLGTMIHEQGDMVDSIEANVESAEVHVDHAEQQLRRAAEYQRASRKKMCILLVILVVIATIIAIIIWQSTK
ncbi:syntaxin-12-like [Lampetra fluviatilis]